MKIGCSGPSSASSRSAVACACSRTGGGVERPPKWQCLGQQVSALAIRDQSRELALQINQFGCRAFGQYGGQRTERARRLRLAGAVPPARTAQVERAEERLQHDGSGVL